MVKRCHCDCRLKKPGDPALAGQFWTSQIHVVQFEVHSTLSLPATMTTYRTANFWAPALHPNTILDLSVPEPGPSRDPIVRSLPIKHNDHAPVGVIKRTLQTSQGVCTETVLANTSFLSRMTSFKSPR